MTKKDYELIARVFKLFAQTDLTNRNANDVIIELSGRLGQELKADNPRFEQMKWDNAIFSK